MNSLSSLKNTLCEETLSSQSKKTLSLNIYTDGGCDVQTTKKGGWGVIVYLAGDISSGRDVTSGCGGEKNTTNNRMELLALYKALKWIEEVTEIQLALKEILKEGESIGKTVIFNIDSMYVINIFYGGEKGGGYCDNWVVDGVWKKKLNLDYIQDIYHLMIKLKKRGYNFKFEHCKAHIGIEGNEAADDLATRGRKYKKTLGK